MATYKKPNFSWHNLVLVFGVCALPIYSWSIYYFLERMPAWLYYLEIWEIISIFAYTQAFALLESIVVLLAVLLAAVILPVLFRGRFVAIGSILVLLTSVLTIFVQHQDNALRTLALVPLLFGLGILLVLVLLLFLIYRQKRVQELVEAFAERVSALLYLYLPMSLIGLVIVVIRNVR